MARYTLLVLAALLAGCRSEPIQRASTGNAEVTAAVIAHVDGCKVYRLDDHASRTVYFMRCPAASTFAAWDVTHSTGKSTWTEHLQAQTEEPAK